MGVYRPLVSLVILTVEVKCLEAEIIMIVSPIAYSLFNASIDIAVK